MEWHNVDQNSDEWFEMRAGLITGSKLGTVMANYGKAFSDTAKKYAVNIAIEQITGRAISSGYSNAHMERGHEQEPIARMLYEQETFCDVTNGGFFEDGEVGLSLDGLVGNDGAIEIKSVIASTHYATIKRQKVDPSYKWQVLGNLMLSARDWIDFVSYCADFPEGKQLFIHRTNRGDCAAEFDMIDIRIKEFLLLIIDTKQIVLESNYL